MATISDYRLAVAVFVGSLFLFCMTLDNSVSLHDEGIILTGALRVLSGDMPHRDFYTNYAPGQLYIVAWLFDLFGQSLLVLRLYDSVVRALIVTVCYLMLSSECRRGTALCMAGITAVWLFFYVHIHGFSSLPGILMSLIAAWLVIPAIARQESNIRGLLLAGSLTGLTAFFRYDASLLLCAALGTAMILSTCMEPGYTARMKFQRLLRLAVPYALTCLPFWGILAAWYAITGNTAAFTHDIIIYSSVYYPATRDLPFPAGLELLDFSLWAIYIPILVIFAGFPVWLSRRLPARQAAFLLVFSLLSISMYNRVIVRTDLYHLLESFIPAMLVLTLLFCSRKQMSFLLRRYIGVVMLIVSVSSAFTFLLLLVTIVSPLTHIKEGIWLSSTCNSEMPPRFYCSSFDPEYQKAIKFITDHTSADERIFSGLGRHDKILIGDQAFYFAAARLPATAWHQLDPGVQTRADVQTHMIAELEKHGVKYIILNSAWDEIKEPNASAVSSGVTVLDDYIRLHYRPVKTFGTLSVWQRVN